LSILHALSVAFESFLMPGYHGYELEPVWADNPNLSEKGV
jgi:hypothetical protein